MPKNSKKQFLSKSRPKTCEGIIRVTAGAYGFIDADKMPRKRQSTPKKTVFIPPGNLNTALDGDTVAYRKTKGDNGEVVKVIKRARAEFVGTIIEDGRRKTFLGSQGLTSSALIIKPDSPKFYAEIIVDSENLPAKISTTEILAGTKVLVRLKSWPQGVENPSGEIIRVLGTAGEHETEMQAIMADKGFVYDFPETVEAEAAQYRDKREQETDLRGRKDFRNTVTFTIDPVKAKDFDDALSVKKLENNLYEIGVHIADVSYYVRPDSALNEEAKKRATSVYLVDRTIPMLPEALSNDLCSLVPEKDRLAYSAVFTLTGEAEIKNEWFGRTIIHSNKRFTYEEVHEIINYGKGPFHEELKVLSRLAKKLDTKKIKAGALAFEEDEVQFEIDDDGRPISVYKKERLESHKLVEDFMLLANKRVAEFVSEKIKNRDQAFVYRVHDAPDPDKFEELIRFIKLFGHKLSFKGKRPRPQEINNFLKGLAGSPDESVITRATIRSMNRALYSMKNIGHFGLAFNHYTHFTSPIRRYPDIMVHRLLDQYLTGEQPSTETLLEYARMCEHSSAMEKVATEAERDSIKFKQAEYLAARIGEIFDGVVAGITKWGMYVEELSTGAEGLIRLRNMLDDHYVFDEKNFRLIGSKTKKTFRLGDKLRVMVEKTDPIAKTIDFTLTPVIPA